MKSATQTLKVKTELVILWHEKITSELEDRNGEDYGVTAVDLVSSVIWWVSCHMPSSCYSRAEETGFGNVHRTLVRTAEAKGPRGGKVLP